LSNRERPPVGHIIWQDLTVDDAEGIRDFYSTVVGWSSEGEDMGGYDDYNMVTEDGEAVAGIVHARGINADLPAQWLFYISVDDLDESMRLCVAGGGKLVTEAKDIGPWGRYCVIQDPAGAVAALIQPPDEK
jgi:predicted enzyme related to lactoylglutathione lyase